MKRRRHSLGALCTLIKGVSPISKTPSGPYPLVTTGEQHKTSDSFQFEGEAVCIPTISSSGHGHASLKRVHYQSGRFALANLLVAAFVKDPAVLSTKFLARYLMFAKDRRIVPLMTGVANMSISPERLATVPIEYPIREDQDRIVAMLEAADELTSLRIAADARSQAIIPALFDKMFGELLTNPLGWPVRAVGELLDSCDYGTSVKANTTGAGVPVLRMGNVTGTGDLDLTDLKTVELSSDELAKQRLRWGDVLFNRTNSRELVGKTGMWDGRFEAVAASYFIRLRFRRDLEHPQHFTAFMNLPETKRVLVGMARGAIGQANINSKELKSIRLPVPPLSLQEDFTKRVAEIRDFETAQARAAVRLDSLFESMLQRAFTGDL